MSKQKRWIKTVIETAKTTDKAMPWQRGERRAVFISRRGKMDMEAKSA